MQKILFLLCPPFWLRLPPLSIAYLSSIAEFSNQSFAIDLNAEIYNLLLKTDKNSDLGYYIKNWEKNENELKQNLFNILLGNSCVKDYIEKIIFRILNEKIGYVGFSVFESNLDFSLKLAGLIKQRAENVNIIFGGPEITMNAGIIKNSKSRMNEMFSGCVDILIEGEGEKTIKKIFEINGKHLFEYEEIENIDLINFPDFDKLNLKLYKTRGCLPVLMSRGCINKCRFCSEKNLYKQIKYRTHSPEYMINLFEFYIKKYGIRTFVFQDSLINGDLRKLEHLCELLISKKMNIKWEGQVYIRENMDKSLFKLMKESGCYNMFIGLESGSDLILKKMKKNFNTASASEFFVKCRENGLHFEISLILGYPGETLNTIDETMNFLKINSALIPKIAQINQYIYYKFSEVTENEYLIQKEVNKNIGIAEHINRILEFAKSCNIKYTKAFINNLAVL